MLYLRNTVDDALDAHADLMARGLDADLFHARFALIDRLAIEKRTIETFGKDSTPGERAGRVLIATQVVEQSLDLDFDVMISDLAPIDLLIQRAGRLWRHERPEREGSPELLVVAPTPAVDADEEWYSAIFPRAAHVYQDHARLWLTAKVLEGTGTIESPGRLRALIEAVYGAAAEERVPTGLMDSFFMAEGRAGAERGISTSNVLSLTKGYVRDGGAWDSDIRTPTRLADDSQVTLRLARVLDGRVVPYAAATPDEPWRAWRLSEVSASARRVTAESVPPEHTESALAAKAAWTRFDQEKALVLLEATGDGGENGAVMGPKEPISLSYSAKTGLMFFGEPTFD